MTTLDPQAIDLDEQALSIYMSWGMALMEIAEMSTDSRLDEAHCFLRARKLAQRALDEFQIKYQDQTFGGKTKT